MEITQWWCGPGRAAACLGAALSILVLVVAPSARADEIAYSCGGDICTIDPNHTETHADLTETPLYTELQPAWSPDGTRIAFTADYPPNSSSDIYVVSPAAPASVLDISNSATEGDSDPAWSADSTELAWEGLNSAANNDIHVAAASGTTTPQLVEPTAAEEREPAWSPTGAELAYGRGTSVFIASPLASLAAHPLSNAVGFFPTWSPDGTKIASVSLSNGSVRIADAAGSGTFTELPVKAESGGAVSWAPDSSHVVYVDSNDEVRVAPTNPPGAGFTIPKPTGFIVPRGPVWSPDGTQIAFAARNDGSASMDQVFVAPASGGEPVQVTKTAMNNFEPTWRPEAGGGSGSNPGGGGSNHGGEPGSNPGGSGSNPGGGSSGSSGPSGSSAGNGTPPATHAPVVLELAAFRHPAISNEFLSGGYVPCNLGSSNAICQAHGEATFVAPITHSLTYSRSKAKPIVFAKGSVTVPNGKTKPLPLRLTAAGKKLMKGRKSLKLTETIIETAPGAKPKATTKTFTVTLPKKR